MSAFVHVCVGVLGGVSRAEMWCEGFAGVLLCMCVGGGGCGGGGVYVCVSTGVPADQYLQY